MHTSRSVKINYRFKYKNLELRKTCIRLSFQWHYNDMGYKSMRIMTMIKVLKNWLVYQLDFFEFYSNFIKWNKNYCFFEKVGEHYSFPRRMSFRIFHRGSFYPRGFCLVRSDKENDMERKGIENPMFSTLDENLEWEMADGTVGKRGQVISCAVYVYEWS